MKCKHNTEVPCWDFSFANLDRNKCILCSLYWSTNVEQFCIHFLWYV